MSVVNSKNWKIKVVKQRKMKKHYMRKKTMIIRKMLLKLSVIICIFSLIRYAILSVLSLSLSLRNDFAHSLSYLYVFILYANWKSTLRYNIKSSTEDLSLHLKLSFIFSRKGIIGHPFQLIKSRDENLFRIGLLKI